MEKTRIIRQIQTYRYMMFSKKTHAYRAHAHTVRVKDLPFHLYHLYLYYGWGGGGCFPDDSRVPRARSTRNRFQINPPPTPTQ